MSTQGQGEKPQEFHYVIEHMEEDDAETKTVPPWVHLEYAHMLKVLPSTSHVHFTSLSKTSADNLPIILSNVGSTSQSSAHLHVSTNNITQLLASHNPPIPVSKVCLLDPKAPNVLSPEDGEPGKFEYFLFGGILGDDPPLDRTGALRALGFEGRHLGEVQMTTDTALAVTKLVVEDKVPLDKIPYVDHPTIVFSQHESVEMPFRYIRLEDGQPQLPDGMRQLLQEDLNKSFDF